MARQTLLGVFPQADAAANAVGRLQQAGLSSRDFDILTGSPYPEGAFGERPEPHRLYVFPFIGAFCGFAVALLLTAGTQLSYPMVTGGKPILAIPPMLVIMYEGTMLGAILFTVLGIIFESRLPRFGTGLYDTRITEGYVGIIVSCDDAQAGQVEQAMQQAGAEEVKHGR